MWSQVFNFALLISIALIFRVSLYFYLNKYFCWLIFITITIFIIEVEVYIWLIHELMYWVVVRWTGVLNFYHLILVDIYEFIRVHCELFLWMTWCQWIFIRNWRILISFCVVMIVNWCFNNLFINFWRIFYDDFIFSILTLIILRFLMLTLAFIVQIDFWVVRKNHFWMNLRIIVCRVWW